MKSKTVSICIPAHNEAKNILNLIQQLALQKTDGYALKEIIVICDGCTDNTCQIAKNAQKKYKNLRVLDDHERKGKPARLNEAFNLINSEVAVVLDADILLASSSALARLVKPLLKDNLSGFVSGRADPLLPRNYVQEIAYAGVQISNDIRAKAGNCLFYCEGSIRAFSKDFYKQLRFPDMSADDAYPYFVAKRMGYQFKYVPQAKIYYRLPSTMRDYLSQQLRYQAAPEIYKSIFGKSSVQSEWSIKFIDRLSALPPNFIKRPFSTLSYLSVFIYFKLLYLIKGPDTSCRWDILTSTK